MTVLRRLAQRAESGYSIPVVLTGAGLIGRALIRQIDITQGMHCALVISRTVEPAVEALVQAGHLRSDIVVSDDHQELQAAIDQSRPAITRHLESLDGLRGLSVLVEATGAVEFGAKAALTAFDNDLHVVMMNAETDGTVGCALKAHADAAGVVYTNADGDQPGVLMRLIEQVSAMGFRITAAVNCKGFMDVHATPDSIAEWASKQGTSLAMTTAFTDGTKMNIENVVIANATGLVPAKRGMYGVTTTLEHALRDCMDTFQQQGLVDYTLGGDFGGGVFVIGSSDQVDAVGSYMAYFKMGAGPDYLFYRPYHLCHLETPVSVAEAVMDGVATIQPMGGPVAEVIASAKRDLRAGERLDGIGGYTCYGQIDVATNTSGFLPAGLCGGVTINRDIAMGDPIELAAVELDDDSLLRKLHLFQQNMTVPASQAIRGAA